MINLILANTETLPPPSSFSWAEFGLAGAVIGALFFTLWFLLRLHKDERKEWKDDAGKRDEQVTTVINKLTDAVKDLGRNA